MESNKKHDAKSMMSETQPDCLGAGISWVATTEKLPDIDQDDKWNKKYQFTKNVLTYSKEWGMRFGRYHYMSGEWTINGVTSSEGVNVDYWMLVKPPCY